MCRRTVRDLSALAAQVGAFGAILWALFFVIPVGRAPRDEALSAEEIEEVRVSAAQRVEDVPFGIKTTEAPHFHRVLAQRIGRPRPTDAARSLPGVAGRPAAQREAIGRAGRAVTDGNGVVFVDHVGEIYPSGFLPLAAGNVRKDDLVSVYRRDPLFIALRDPGKLEGRCGVCAYRDRCGGSRARALAIHGSPLAEDPGCAYRPALGREP